MKSEKSLKSPLATIMALALACGACVAAEPVTEPASAAPPMSDKAAAAFERKGKIAFLLCRSCHTVDQGGEHLVGPNLHGVFGATAGQKEGYEFSAALQSADIVWNRESMNEWLLNPAQKITGNKMAFVGIPSDEDRAALISYLEKITQ